MPYQMESSVLGHLSAVFHTLVVASGHASCSACEALLCLLRPVPDLAASGGWDAAMSRRRKQPSRGRKGDDPEWLRQSYARVGVVGELLSLRELHFAFTELEADLDELAGRYRT